MSKTFLTSSLGFLKHLRVKGEIYLLVITPMYPRPLHKGSGKVTAPYKSSGRSSECRGGTFKKVLLDVIWFTKKGLIYNGI